MLSICCSCIMQSSARFYVHHTMHNLCHPCLFCLCDVDSTSERLSGLYREVIVYKVSAGDLILNHTLDSDIVAFSLCTEF